MQPADLRPVLHVQHPPTSEGSTFGRPPGVSFHEPSTRPLTQLQRPGTRPTRPASSAPRTHQVRVFVDLGECSPVRTKDCSDEPGARTFALDTLMDAYLEQLDHSKRRVFWCEIEPGRWVHGRWQPDPRGRGRRYRRAGPHHRQDHVQSRRKHPVLAGLRRCAVTTSGRSLTAWAARLYVAHEAPSGWVYLGFRWTDDPDLDSLTNLGHVRALVRASADLIDPLGSVTAYLVADGNGAAFRWRLHRASPGIDPVLTEGDR
jgi:hypothetical protein